MRNLLLPEPSEAGAIKRIVNSSDGLLFIKYLKRNLTSADEDNRSIGDDVDLRRSQGKALTIKAILDTLEAK